jgi:hypothetical protein
MGQRKNTAKKRAVKVKMTRANVFDIGAKRGRMPQT